MPPTDPTATSPLHLSPVLMVLSLVVVAVIVAAPLLIAHAHRRATRGPHAAPEAETKPGSIVATMPDAVLTFDARGVVESINPAAAALFGLDEGWAGWVHIRELLPEIDAVGPASAEDPTGGARTVQTTGRRIDGAAVSVEVALAHMEIPGGVLHNVVIRDASVGGRRQASPR